MKIVRVEWIDSISCGGSVWANNDEVAKLMPDTIKSVGFLVKEEDDFLIVAGHVGGHQTSGDICIPRCAVQRVTVLRK